MAIRKNGCPPPGELELMAMLWREGPLTLAQAHERFADTAGRSATRPCRRG